MSQVDASYVGIYGEHAGLVFDKALEIAPLGTVAKNDVVWPESALYLGPGLFEGYIVMDVLHSVLSPYCDIIVGTEGFPTEFTVGSILMPVSGYKGRVVVPFRNAIGNSNAPMPNIMYDGRPLPYLQIRPFLGSDDTALTFGAFITKK